MWTQKGIALIVVLWILVILEAVIGGFIYITRLESKITQYHLQELQALALTKAGVEKAISEIYRQDSLVEKTKILRQSYPYQHSGKLEDVTIEILLTNEESKINLNTVSRELLDKLFFIQGITNKEQLASGIIWWRDKNRRFDTWKELLLLKGVDIKILDTLQNRATVYSNGRINVNTAPSQILEILPGFENGKEKIYELLQFRNGLDNTPGTEDDKYLNEEDVKKIMGENNFSKVSDLLTYYGETFQVISCAKIGKRTKKVTAVLIRKSSDKKVKVIYWQEE